MKQGSKIYVKPFSLLDIERILEIEKSSFTSDTFSEDMFKYLYDKCYDLFIVAEMEGLIKII
jgi:hypothetical protein